MLTTNERINPTQGVEVAHKLRNHLNLIALAMQRMSQCVDREDLLVALELAEQVQYSAMASATLLSENLSTAGVADFYRVLVVEDDVAQGRLIADVLRNAGFFVAEVADGDQAIDYLYRMPRPDAIITDLQMPNCDGAELLRIARLSARGEGVLIVSVSGTTIVANGQFTADMTFLKPIDSEQLVTQLRARLTARKLLDDVDV